MFNLVYLTSSSVHAAPDVPGMYTVSISGPGFVASPFKITSSKIRSSTERIEGYSWNFLQAFLPFNNLKHHIWPKGLGSGGRTRYDVKV